MRGSLLQDSHSQSLGRYPLFRATDLDDAHALIAKNVSPHQINILRYGKSLDVSFCGFHLDGISLLGVGYGAEVEVRPESSDFYFLQTTVNGKGSVTHGRESCATEEGSTVAVSPGVPYQMKLQRACRRLVIGLNADKLRRHLSQLIYEEVGEDLVFDFTVHNKKVWNNTVNFVVQQLEITPSLLQNNHFCKVYSDLLMSTLLEIQPHNYSKSFDKKADIMACVEVKKAIDYIQENIRSSISMVDLSRFCNVSARTLQRNFVKHMDQTPTAYIRNAKLEAIHRELFAANPNQNGIITRLLLDYSILDSSRFSKYYQHKYGCTPSETLRNRK